MAEKERMSVAHALNSLTDLVLVAALSSHDPSSMSELVADFFCGDQEMEMSSSEEGEEPGNCYMGLIIIPFSFTKYLRCTTLILTPLYINFI